MALLITAAPAQESVGVKRWRSPKSCVLTRNPIRPTRTSIKAGRKIFEMRCAGCHGRQGRGDGEDASQLRVRPAILSSTAVQEQTDGALWWKITLGRKPMPGYGFRLSMTDRWHLINYLRTFRED